MGIGIKHTIVFLVVMSSFFSLPEAKGGCAGGCFVSGGGGASTGFMGDRAVNIGMSSFDEFVRDNLGSDPGATMRAKSLSRDNSMSTNTSQNSSAVMSLINSTVNITSDNRIIKLGASGMQDYRLSTLTSTIFNGNRL